MSIIDGLLFCKKYSAGTLAATDSVVSPKRDGPILPDDKKVKVKTGEKGDEPLSLVSIASSNQTKWRSFSPSWLLCTIADTRGLFHIVIFFLQKEKKRPQLMHWITCVKKIRKETTTCLWTKVALELWDMFGLVQ